MFFYPIPNKILFFALCFWSQKQANVSMRHANLQGTVEGVKELQRFLNDKLNLGLALDGRLGLKTIAVIRKWQKAHGLVPDGLIGTKTKALMNKLAK